MYVAMSHAMVEEEEEKEVGCRAKGRGGQVSWTGNRELEEGSQYPGNEVRGKVGWRQLDSGLLVKR